LTAKDSKGNIIEATSLVKTTLVNTPIPKGSIMDNCLFVVNQSQLDEDGNNVGNMCDINDRI
jgi:hypothetical protein